MRPSPSSRAGSASRSVLLLALLAGAIVLVLALVLRTPSPVGGTDPVGIAGSGKDAEDTGLSEADAAPRDALTAPAAAAAPSRPVGTRLAGEGRLEGRVVDRTTGAGVAAARVELLPFPPAAATLAERILRLFGLGSELPDSVRPIASALSSDDGTFGFRGVRAGSWFVDARGPYHAPEGSLRAEVLASGSGGPLEVHVVAGGRVLGRVLAPDGKPARSAKVFLMGGPGRFLSDVMSGDLRLFETTADAEGAYVFEGVPPGGGYDVSASDDSFAVSHVLGVDVVARADARVDVQAREGGGIRGRVVSSRDGAAPEPVVGAHVAAVPRGIRDLLLVGEVLASTHAVTGADGEFLLQHVPPGEVDLAVVALGHLPSYGGPAVAADGATTSAADLVLSTGRKIRGRTVDASGAAIAGVQVRWNPLEGTSFDPGELNFAPILLQKVPGFLYPTTDAEGRFEAGPFAGGGSHEIGFHKLGWKDETKHVPEDAMEQELVVVLSRGGVVEGSVVDAADEKPITSFDVATEAAIDVEAGAPKSWNPFARGTRFEDPGGRFRLPAVKAGRAELRVGSAGYAFERVEVDVPEGGRSADVVVRLRRGAVVRGIVVDDKGLPVAGARVVTISDGEKRPDSEGGDAGLLDEIQVPPPLMQYAVGLGFLADRQSISGAKGEFELAGVPPGSRRCRAFHRDYAFGLSDSFRIEAGASFDGVRIEMNAGGGVEGKVRDRNGRPVADVAVVALAPMAMTGIVGNAAMGALYQGQSDDEGRYRIEHMATGNYFLLATRGDEALHPMSFLGRMNLDVVSIPKGEIVHYDLVDSTSGVCRVTGRLLDAGVPVETGVLVAMAAEGNGSLGIDLKMARVSREGRFEFPGLAPGAWQLTLQDAGPGGEVRMRLDVPDQAEYAVVLNLPEGGLEGTVVDAANGEPIEDAHVRLRLLGAPKPKGLLAMVVQQRDAREERTDEHGGFSFGRVCAGDYELTVGGAGGKGSKAKRRAPSDPLTVRIEEGRIERGHVIRLSAPASMKGLVLGMDGRPIENADIRARRQDQPGSRSERTETDASGRFELTGLAPGVYAVEARAKDHASDIARDVQVSSGPEPTEAVEIRLSRGTGVVLRVLQSGQPVAGARAVATREGGDPDVDEEDADRALEGLFKGEGISDAEGRIDLGRFGKGSYRIEVTRGEAVREHRFTVEAGSGGMGSDMEIGISLP